MSSDADETTPAPGTNKPGETTVDGPDPIIDPDTGMVITPGPDMGSGGPEPDMAVEPEPEPMLPFDAASPEARLRKTKTLLTGLAPTDEELTAVRDNPDALKGLIEGWLETPQFETKFSVFLSKALQQEEGDRGSIVSQVRNSDAVGGFRPPNKTFDMLRESFVRTAWKLVEEGQPFHAIASTRRWQMTTAMMSFMLLIDEPWLANANQGAVEHRFYKQPFNGFNATTPLRRQIEERTWYVPTDLNEKCEDGLNGGDYQREYQKGKIWSALTGNYQCDGNSLERYEDRAPLSADDYTDWREVEIVTATAPDQKTPYWDILELRGADRVALVIPRAGFFSTPTFLAKWRSNVDNSFRVTTNQALIVGLGESFEDDDFTLPLTQENLADEHAGPGTTCYGCHVSLDPMRNVFFNIFEPDTYAPLKETLNESPSFGFFGHQEEISDMADFGRVIALHPIFARAWVQKLCFYANSRECLEDDPEFERIVQVFVGSDFNMKTLVAELFASPLVTGAERTTTHNKSEFLASITRADHFCSTLSARIERTVCGNNTRALVASLPADAWLRGTPTPVQPATSSLFYASTVEAICERAANASVNTNGSPLQSQDMAASKTFLVEQLMGLAPGDSRYTLASETLETFEMEADAITTNKRDVLRAMFTFACTSPLVVSTGL